MKDQDNAFLEALYYIEMNIHIYYGTVCKKSLETYK